MSPLYSRFFAPRRGTPLHRRLAPVFVFGALCLNAHAQAEKVLVKYTFDNLTDPLGPSIIGDVDVSSLYSKDPYLLGTFNTAEQSGANPGALPQSPMLKLAPVPTRFDSESYAAFTLQALPGKTLSIDRIYLDFATGGNGNGTFYLRSSLDGFTRNLVMGMEPVPAIFSRYSVTLGGTTASEITFRLYATSDSTKAREARIDNITVLGSTPTR